jgi:ABC-type histidine transport system ATPase subunit
LPDTTCAVQAKNLSKSYGNNHVLKGIDRNVEFTAEGFDSIPLVDSAAASFR